jgi:uncharacterized hydrophobic protein (TIGR00341 family)
MKIIEVIAEAGHLDTVIGIAEQYEVADYWTGGQQDEARRSVRLLVDDDKRQAVLDALQTALGGSEKAHILVQPVEAALPKTVSEEDKDQEKRSRVQITREELYDRVEKNARLDQNFIVLVCLSTVVVAIGLIEDNIAVVIGAMVIAPLLGPNIALALSTSLGDMPMMWQALRTNLTGIAIALLLSTLIGSLWGGDPGNRELLLRTDVGLDSVALALVSGAAAVLSLTTGLPSVLVGVMVAVALLPPAATMGIMLGASKYSYATGAGLLLAVNIVCVNLAAKLAFLAKGIKPRTWIERQKARQSMTVYIVFWITSLVLLLALIYLLNKVDVPA